MMGNRRVLYFNSICPYSSQIQPSLTSAHVLHTHCSAFISCFRTSEQSVPASKNNLIGKILTHPLGRILDVTSPETVPFHLSCISLLESLTVPFSFWRMYPNYEHVWSLSTVSFHCFQWLAFKWYVLNKWMHERANNQELSSKMQHDIIFKASWRFTLMMC